jgi:hypothetical protein
MEANMRMSESRMQLQRRAAETLKLALSGVSTISLKEIRHDSEIGGDGQSTFMAYVDVYGRTHALACEIQTHGDIPNVRATLDALGARVRHVDSNATPVLIVPSVSQETQKACKECRTGFLDLEGNARLWLGDVFIVKRTMPAAVPAQVGEFAAVDAASMSEPIANRSVHGPRSTARSRHPHAHVGEESEVGMAVA